MTKTPNPIDKYVGSRVRMRRMMLGMSQEKLGDQLGLTFQQVQKYEKGMNRIGASRLQQIANIMQVPVSFFFEGAPGGDATAVFAATSAVPVDVVAQVAATRDGLRLITAFANITAAKARHALADLVEEMASLDAPDEQLRKAG
jgi:transcriptional regulator with XRE-family HTH domain